MKSLQWNKTENLYFLKNRNETLLSFKWKDIEPEDKAYKVISPSIYDITPYSARIPSFIKYDFVKWLNNRVVPIGREYIELLLEHKKIDKNVKAIVDYGKALSLQDGFWITQNLNQTWEEINHIVGGAGHRYDLLLLTGEFDGETVGSLNPIYELTLGGTLPKSYINGYGHTLLIKGGTIIGRNSGREPITEVMASELLDILNYKHARYKLSSIDGRPFSCCSVLYQDEVGKIMVPMEIALEDKSTDIYSIIGFCKQHNMEEDLYKMLIFDYIIMNSDRHLNNISVTMHDRGSEILELTSIYDNGAGLLAYKLQEDTLEEYLEMYKPALYDSYEEIASYCKQELKSEHNIERLSDKDFLQSKLLACLPESADNTEIEMVKEVAEVVHGRVMRFLDKRF